MHGSSRRLRARSAGRWPHAVGRSFALILLLVAAGCGSGSEAAGSGDTADLHAAVDRTLAADSFHIELSSASPDAGGTASIDYNAPDRIRTVFEDGTRSIIVGDTVYLSDFERPDHFLSSKRSGSAAADNLLLFLRAIREARPVNKIGDEFVATLGDNEGTARVLVRDGYVVRLRMHSGSGEGRLDATYEFSRFGSADTVSPPPADTVSESPATAECPKNGETPVGLVVCTGAAGSESESVQLPSLSGPADSSLQFRPVRGRSPVGCAVRDGNPPAADPAVLADSSGTCLDLEAAGLEVERVKELDATRQGETITLTITLLDADARRFEDLAAANLGEQLALVIFGHVVSAPTIHGTGFGGRLSVSDMTLDEAARVKAALT